MAKTQPAPEPTVEPVGKGHATPTRKEREEARKRPLVPTDRKLAAQRDKAMTLEQREKARRGALNGEDKYLTPRDAGPQRRFVRDYVDARFSVGEILMPLMVLAIVAFWLPFDWSTWATYVVWAFFLIALVDFLVSYSGLRKRLIQKFGKEKIERGLLLYAITRTITLRPLRFPKPLVKYGQYPK